MFYIKAFTLLLAAAFLLGRLAAWMQDNFPTP